MLAKLLLPALLQVLVEPAAEPVGEGVVVQRLKVEERMFGGWGLLPELGVMRCPRYRFCWNCIVGT